MLHGEETGRYPRRGADFGVDVLDVIASGLGRDNQAGGDLLVREAESEQPKDVDLTCREAGGPFTTTRQAMSCSGQHSLNGIAIEATFLDVRP